MPLRDTNCIGSFKKKNNYILIQEIEFVGKNLCTKETPTPDVFSY